MITTDITMQFGRTPGALRLLAPYLGEHTRPILASVGHTPGHGNPLYRVPPALGAPP